MNTQRAPEPPAPRPPNPLMALILHHTVTTLFLVGALALGIWGYLTYRKGGFTYGRQDVSTLSTQRYLIESQVERLELAAHTYRRLNQSAPLSLDALVESGLIQADDLRYPSRHVSYQIEHAGEALRVTYTMNVEAVAPPPSPDELVAPVQ